MSGEALGITDDVRRVIDAVNLHLTVLPVEQFLIDPGVWIGVRLMDGRTNGTAYGSFDEAKRYHDREMFPYAYLRVPASGMPPAEAARWLQMMREFRERGLQLVDPAVMGARPR